MISKMYNGISDFYTPADGARARACALICCDEIIAALDFDWMEVQNLDREHAYWVGVKQHIENQ